MIQNVLIVQLKMVGDVLASSLICDNLKRINPKYQIHFVAYEFTSQVISNNPNIDKIWIYRDEYRNNPFKILQFVQQLRQYRFHYIVDSYGKLESYIITSLSRGDIKIGYHKSYNRIFYDKRIKRLDKRFEETRPTSINNRLSLIKSFTSGDFEWKLKPQIYLAKSQKEKAKLKAVELKSKGHVLIMLNITGSSMNKTYPLKYMLKLVDDLLLEFKINLVLNYSPNLKSIVQNKIEESSARLRSSIVRDIHSKSLSDYIETASICDVVIGNEGGGINIAKALSVPTFAIFSPQVDPRDWAHRDDLNDYVHLCEYRPKIVEGVSKEKRSGLYYLLEPKYIKSPLLNFLKRTLELN